MWEAPAGAFIFEKLRFLEFWDMPIFEKVCISLYLVIFQVTAATAAAVVSQELSPFGKAPGPSRPGTKYPVRGIPHFDYLLRSLRTNTLNRNGPCRVWEDLLQDCFQLNAPIALE